MKFENCTTGKGVSVLVSIGSVGIGERKKAFALGGRKLSMLTNELFFERMKCYTYLIITPLGLWKLSMEPSYTLHSHTHPKHRTQQAKLSLYLSVVTNWKKENILYAIIKVIGIHTFRDGGYREQKRRIAKKLRRLKKIIFLLKGLVRFLFWTNVKMKKGWKLGWKWRFFLKKLELLREKFVKIKKKYLS